MSPALSQTRWTAARSPRSALIAEAVTPWSRSRATAWSSSACLRATTTTSAPARPMASAMAYPMPELPPVTSARRPCRENSSRR